jgi:hypothetical protein
MRKRRRPYFCLLSILLFLASSLPAQERPAALTPTGVTRPATQAPPRTEGPKHTFWDRRNAWLFAGVGAARALDYASSQDFRAKGVNERLLSNRIVDNKPLFVGIEVAGTFASIGVAYLFHRSGHHKIERWISIVHIGVGVGGSVRNFLLQPDPPAVASR